MLSETYVNYYCNCYKHGKFQTFWSTSCSYTSISTKYVLMWIIFIIERWNYANTSLWHYYKYLIKYLRLMSVITWYTYMSYKRQEEKKETFHSIHTNTRTVCKVLLKLLQTQETTFFRRIVFLDQRYKICGDVFRIKQMELC